METNRTIDHHCMGCVLDDRYRRIERRLRRLGADAHPDNQAAQRLMERLVALEEAHADHTCIRAALS
jgi:RimJ/RimL family protein N-acetyltransferase